MHLLLLLPLLVASPSVRAAEPPRLASVTVLGSRIQQNPSARAIGRVERDVLEATDAFSLKDLMDKKGIWYHFFLDFPSDMPDELFKPTKRAVLTDRYPVGS